AAHGHRQERDREMTGARALAGLIVALSACAGANAREESAEKLGPGDIVVRDAAAPSTSENTYEYTTERPFAIVGLAEARGMPKEIARAAVDRIADTLDVCATEQARAGKLVDGASRVVAIVGKDGAVAGVNVTFSGGGAV